MDTMENNKATTSAKSSGLLIVLGFICAIASLFIYPFIFGVVGVILGILATKNGGRAGLSVVVLSIILMAVGLIYGGVIRNYVTHYLGI